MDSYDEIPYESTPITETDPDRLAVTGRLFGLETPDPASCHVLELGCAAGGNLIPLAWQYPDSRFVGVELSERQVAAGRNLVKRLGLGNVEIREVDILQLNADMGEFDYIICHGVWSWVPDEVRERILGLCANCLSPGGIAYISYNVLPGWRLKGMLRDMLLYHLRDIEAPRQRLENAIEFIDFLERASAGLEALHIRQLKSQIKRIRETHPSYFYHEYLEAVNEPFLFSDFMQRAESQGLTYLADTELHTMFPSTMGDEVESALAGLEDVMAQEQYMDFLGNRAFRQTLLCRGDALNDRELDLERFESFAFYADLALPRKLDLHREKSQPFRRPDGEEVRVSHPLTKAAVAELSRRYPDSIAFSPLVERARSAVAAAGGGQYVEAMDHLFGELFSLFLHQHVGASISARTFPRAGDRPLLTSLSRALLDEGLDHLATPRHTTITLDPLTRRMAMLLDGKRDVDAIIAVLTSEIAEHPARFPEWQSDLAKPERLSAQLGKSVERLLVLFSRQGLMDA
ncbi:MAG: class I SAM-dependent methyltransferase [Gammaproteobacteria bacterium]